MNSSEDLVQQTLTVPSVMVSWSRSITSTETPTSSPSRSEAIYLQDYYGADLEDIEEGSGVALVSYSPKNPVLTLGRVYNSPSTISTKRKALISDLEELKEIVTIENWDKEGAPPLDDRTFSYAEQFIQRLPIDQIKSPDIYATAHGAIVFSWESEEVEDTFEIIILTSGDIATSGIFGTLEVIGRVRWDDKGIRRLCDLILWISRD